MVSLVWITSIILVLIIMPGIFPAFAQIEINVTDSGEVCFLNYTAGADMWNQCGVQEDFIAMTLLPFQWVTGGIFSIIIVAVIIIMVYMKYQSAIYPIAIGLIMLPISYFAFPDEFIIFAVVMAFLAVGTFIWYALIRQTKEY